MTFPGLEITIIKFHDFSRFSMNPDRKYEKSPTLNLKQKFPWNFPENAIVNKRSPYRHTHIYIYTHLNRLVTYYKIDVNRVHH